MALEVSVVLVVVDLAGCEDGPRTSESAAKLPPEVMDSAARESERTVPGFSILGFETDSWVVVTWSGW